MSTCVSRLGEYSEHIREVNLYCGRCGSFVEEWIEPNPWRIRQALIDAWEAGNCTGLDGWVGEDRGTQEPDQQAIYNRDRDVNRLINGLFPDA